MADAEVQSTAQMTPAGQPPQGPDEGHTAVGKLYHSVLGALGGSTNTDYQPDPETGQVKPVQTPKTPGQQWKQIIAGAMTGLAAGATAPRRPGAEGLAGAGAGFNAAASRTQAQDQQKRNQAQQQLENMDQATLRKAQLAKMNQDRIMWSRDMRNMDVAEASQFETAMGAVDKQMEEAGAQKMPIMVGGKDINGQPGNANALMQYFSDPKAHQPPDGYHLVKGQKTDFSGLQKNAKGDWVDEKGQPVDLASRTGHYVYAVPDKAMDQMVSIDPGEFEKNTGMHIETQGPVRLKLSAYMAGVQNHVKESSEEHLRQSEEQKNRAEAGKASAETKQLGMTSEAATDTAQQLVSGNMDPSQLSKRATKGSDSYNAILSKANELSMQQTGKPFDVEKASRDYKFASNTGTQNTLRYLNSLTGAHGKPGNLDTLVDMSNKINRTQFPALNNAAVWARLQTGDPAMAAYHAAVTEVADQTAKILQGGSGSGTSDAKLKEAQGLFAKGFTKQQIAEVASTLRTMLGNRKREMVGDNFYLQKSYGEAPAGATHEVIQGGRVIGHVVGNKFIPIGQ